MSVAPFALRMRHAAVVFAVAGFAGASTPPPPAGWLHVDVPLWDIADEGLPFRLTYSRTSPVDPLARAFLASEVRWTMSGGYARVYDSYDAATGVFKHRGGHAALASIGRQFRWHPPAAFGRGAPALAIELGVHAATRRFPADGTAVNVKLITGLEWTLPHRSGRLGSIGVMWLHFSNANLFPRNAGYDGLAVRFGRRL
ncbi:MAG: acyloxyacyl hydrolase [Verrucomicrobia bacterium]|nr:acyloxyacyl hydrolase [Verrucomicrobiota bacterium]